MIDLVQKKCVACEGGIDPLNKIEAGVLLKQIPGWILTDADADADADAALSIRRSFTFKNFAEALAFTNKVGGIAEDEGHHPDITLAWGKVDVALTTHAIKGLSENDFILAAKINQLM